MKTNPREIRQEWSVLDFNRMNAYLEAREYAEADKARWAQENRGGGE